MNIIRSLRHFISDFLWLRSLRIHKSRMGRVEAPAFTKHLHQCQRHFQTHESSPLVDECIQDFHKNGYFFYHSDLTLKLAASILKIVRQEEKGGLPVWDDGHRYAHGDVFQKFPEVETLLKSDVGEILKGIFGANFKIFFGVMYKSIRTTDTPEGSQLWHADGGPGTCINMMFCLDELSPANGAMECLSFDDSLKIYAKERPAVREAKKNNINAGKAERELRGHFYKTEIDRHFAGNIAQPSSSPGLIYAFRNNCIHKGGFVEPGQERNVIVFHIYPSEIPTPFDKYRESGIGKTRANPEEPDF